MNLRIVLLVALVVGIAGTMIWVSGYLGDEVPLDAVPAFHGTTVEPEPVEPSALLSARSREPGAADEPSGPTREALRGTFTVRGVVSAGDGSPLVGRQAFVELFGATKREVRVDGTGHYALADLVAGRYSLTFRARGCETVRLELALDGRGRVVERDVQLERHGLLLVRMSSTEGEPLIEALKRRSAGLGNTIAAVATVGTPPTWLADFPTQGQEFHYGVGTFTTRRDPSIEYARNFAGELTVTADPPYFVAAVFNQAVLARHRVVEGQDAVDFILGLDEVLNTLAVVRARVVDAESGDLLRATPMVARSVQMPGFRHTSGRGEVEWKGLWAGKQLLRISATGHARWSREVDLKPREVLDLGTIQITRGKDLVVTVLGPDGRPVAAAFVVTPIAPDTGVAQSDLALAAGSNAAGTMRVRSLEPVRYLLHTRGQRALASGPIIVDMSAGPVSDLVITLKAATRVTIRPGAGFRWYRLEANGHPIQNGIPLPRGFSIQLVPGSYELVLGDQSGERERRKFEVGDSPITIE
ncbi:MAG: carboxypeptidase regulatory-like domain-containing protein [Planctomycetota bacterium]|nr:MAG: carboxypeptidase regulatory-like domain-containing protein [Planctomycetota bacterium]